MDKITKTSVSINSKSIDGEAPQLGLSLKIGDKEVLMLTSDTSENLQEIISGILEEAHGKGASEIVRNGMEINLVLDVSPIILEEMLLARVQIEKLIEQAKRHEKAARAALRDD